MSPPGVLNPGPRVPQVSGGGGGGSGLQLRGFLMDPRPLHLQRGNCNIDPGAPGDAQLPDSVIRQRRSVWAEHGVRIDFSGVGAESFEVEICRGN